MGAALLRAGTVSGRRLDPVPADEIPLHRQAAHPIAPPLAASKK
jgi:hypothetical protein